MHCNPIWEKAGYAFFVSIILLALPGIGLSQEYAAAERVYACPPGSFIDPDNNSTCWSCPEGYYRSLSYPVTSSKACEGPNKVYAQATNETVESCPVGSTYDRAYGGSCWSCPEGYIRAEGSITDSTACIKGEKPSTQGSNPRVSDIYRAIQCQKLVGVLTWEREKMVEVGKIDEMDDFLDGEFRVGYAANAYSAEAPKDMGLALDFLTLVTEKEVFFAFSSANPKQEVLAGRFTVKGDATDCPAVPLAGYDSSMGQTCWAYQAYYFVEKAKHFLQDSLQNRKVIITGHGQGGAVAAYFAYQLVSQGLLDKSQTHRLVTLSAPRYAPKSLRTNFHGKRLLNAPLMTADALETERDPVTLSWAQGVDQQLEVSAFGTIHSYTPEEFPSDFFGVHLCCTYLEKSVLKLLEGK